MSEQDKKQSEPQAPVKDDNPFCHTGMTCKPGCSCAGEDGKCHCSMISDRRCTCNGLCGVRM